MVNVLSLILMDNDNVSYIKTVCVKVHSHTVITHVLKVFIICSNLPLIQYMVILTLCKSLYVCVHNPFCERIPLQENMKDFVFLTLYLKKERKKKKKKDLLWWSLVRAFLVLTPSISNKKVHLSTKASVCCGDFFYNSVNVLWKKWQDMTGHFL